MATKHDLLLLFEHPIEPVLMDKCKRQTVFDVPEKFLSDRHKSMGNKVQSSFSADSERRIPVRDTPFPLRWIARPNSPIYSLTSLHGGTSGSDFSGSSHSR